MGNEGVVFQINVSRGGVPKTPIEEADVDYRGITRDSQADKRYHGSPGQALCLYAVEKLAELAAEGHHIGPGSTGENITLYGVDWSLITPGRQLRIGDEVLIEVTDYASPCKKNARWFKDGNFNRINHALHPGWSRVYARVLDIGHIKTGDRVVLPEHESAADRMDRRQPFTYRWPRDFAQAGG